MNQKDIEHYFDWASTTPPDEDILQSSLSETLGVWGNPSSLHTLGKKAKELLESARERTASALGVKPNQIYFTSGGTESNHLAILSVLSRPQKGSVLVSAIEHPAVKEETKELEKCAWRVSDILPNKDGIITPEAVLEKLQDDTALVCVMAVNNETGAVQPFKEIAESLKHKSKGGRAKLHVDCVQAAGKISLNISETEIASAAFSAHKLCGPRGIGVLYLKEPIESFLRGGGQEKNIRSGTENVFGALCIAKCFERYYIPEENRSERFEAQKNYTRIFLQKLSEMSSCKIIPEARLKIESEKNYSPWIVQASFKNIPGQVLLRALDAEGFFISTGSACSSRKNSRPVLEAMGVSKTDRENAVRFSFGHHTTEKAMIELAEKVKEISERFNKA